MFDAHLSSEPRRLQQLPVDQNRVGIVKSFAGYVGLHHRLKAVSVNGQITDFVYDSAGNLLQQRSSANVTTFVLDQLTNVAAYGTSGGAQQLLAIRQRTRLQRG